MCKFSAVLLLPRKEPSSQISIGQISTMLPWEEKWVLTIEEINLYRIFFLWFLITLKLLISNLHNKKHCQNDFGDS